MTVVGVIPAHLPSDQDLRVTRNRQSVGIRVPDKLLKPADTTLPLRIVAPITSEAPRGGLKLYFLTDIDPGDQLYNAHVINQDVVFYLSEYRTNATNVSSRKRD